MSTSDSVSSSSSTSSPASLLTILHANLEHDRRKALRRYGALLAAEAQRPRGEAGDPAAVGVMKSLMMFLDKSEAEVRADADLVKRAQRTVGVDLLAVEVRPVEAPQVADEPVPLG